MKKLFIFLIIIGNYHWSLAVDDIRDLGNGGDAVVCVKPGDKTRVELFDYMEARVLDPQMTFDLGSEQLTVQEKVAYVLARLQKVSPRRAAKYKAFIKSISTDRNFVDSELVQVHDTHHSIMPANCELKQVALHLNHKFDSYRKRVLINRSLYQQMDDNSKAGLFIHEAIYNELIMKGKIFDSSGVRFLNAAISSKKKITKESLSELLANAGLSDSVEMQPAAVADIPFVNLVSASTPPKTPAPAHLPDLVVTSISMSPASPRAGEPVTFSAVITNQGQEATPSKAVIGVGFFVNGTDVTWGSTRQTLRPGASVTLVADSGPTGLNTFVMREGHHVLMAWVNDANRFPESNPGNNTLTTTFEVAPPELNKAHQNTPVKTTFNLVGSAQQ